MNTLLKGVKVLDLTSFVAGPTSTQLMAYMGANVVKVEMPVCGDSGRGMMNMKIGHHSGNILQTNHGRKSIELDIQDSEGREVFKRLVKDYDIVLEGFRPGKVPRKVLEAEFGKDVFLNDALDIILPKYFEEALEKETSVEPVSRPEADILEASDKAVKFAVTITVQPEVKLGKYKGVKVAKEKFEVTDDQVQAELLLAQDKAARVVEIEKDRKAKKGDICNIDFEGSVGGVKFDGGAGKDYDLELGSKTFIPGFEEGVVGMKKGETKDITVTFPKEYSEDLAGKEAVFKVTLNAIKVKELPELNDDFAKDVSEFDTLDAYKADIKAGLEKQAEERAEVAEENKRVEAIVKNATVEVPECMIADEVEEMIKEFEYRLLYQGMKLDDYLRYSGITREKMAEDYREAAERNVRIRLVLEAIIKAENVLPDEEAVNKKIEDMAKGQNKTIDEYKKDMDPRYLTYLLNQSLTDTLMAKLKELNPAK